MQVQTFLNSIDKNRTTMTDKILSLDGGGFHSSHLSGAKLTGAVLSGANQIGKGSNKVG